MSRTTLTPPAKKQKDKEYAWHRHPALIATVAGLFTVGGAVAAVFLGQADVLPAAINPAPAPSTVFSTETETATTTATTTTTVTQTVTAEAPTGPVNTSGTVQPPPAGSLAITVQIGRSGQIGPHEYQVGAVPTAAAEVFDSTGSRVSNGCYTSWELKRGSTSIQKSRSGSCWGTTFHFSSAALNTVGTYHLTVSVQTDNNETGTQTADFKVT